MVDIQFSFVNVIEISNPLYTIDQLINLATRQERNISTSPLRFNSSHQGSILRKHTDYHDTVQSPARQPTTASKAQNVQKRRRVHDSFTPNKDYTFCQKGRYKWTEVKRQKGRSGRSDSGSCRQQGVKKKEKDEDTKGKRVHSRRDPTMETKKKKNRGGMCGNCKLCEHAEEGSGIQTKKSKSDTGWTERETKSVIGVKTGEVIHLSRATTVVIRSHATSI